MWQQKLTKIEIAKQQLLHAIELFCSGEKLISAITLAGAAEEILGKLVAATGQTNSLEREVKDQCELFESIFSRAQDQKAVYGIQNKARNELKHVCDGNDVDLDLEQEAVDLIQRAIDNFQLLRPGFNSAFQAFDDKAAAWWRNRTDQFTKVSLSVRHED